MKLLTKKELIAYFLEQIEGNKIYSQDVADTCLSIIDSSKKPITRTQLAERLGMTRELLYRYIVADVIPEPTITAGERIFYKAEVADFIVKDFKKKKYELLNVQQLDKYLDCTRHQFIEFKKSNTIPPPVFTVGKSVVYTQNDLKTIKRMMRPYKGKTKVSGFFTRGDVSREIGIAHVTVDHHISKGRIEKPTHRVASQYGLFYNQSEYNKVIAFFTERMPQIEEWRIKMNQVNR